MSSIEIPPNRPERGCWEHCVAALVGCDPLGLPDLSRFYPENYDGQPGDWWEVMEDWLDARGQTLAVVMNAPPNSPHIVTGPSPRTESDRHAVVMAGDELLYDPHSSGDGLAEGEWSRYLVLDREELDTAAARARSGGPGG